MLQTLESFLLKWWKLLHLLFDGGFMSDEVSKLEVELTKATGVPIPVNRNKNDFQAFLLTLLKTALDLPDDQYATLSEEAKDWLDVSADNWNHGRPIPNLDSNIKVDNVAESPKEEVFDRAAVRESVTTTPQGKTKKVKSNRSPAGVRVKELLIEHGLELDYEHIKVYLDAEGLSFSPQTFTSVKYELKQTLVLLDRKGLLRKAL